MPVQQPEQGRTTAGRISAERVRPDASFKIKDSLKKISQAQPEIKVQAVIEKQVTVNAHDAFDEKGVIAALEKYIQTYTPEPTVAVALKTHCPGIQGDNIIIAVDNQLQMEKLEGMKMHLQNTLMKSLNNGHLSIGFKIFDSGTSKEEKKLFTAGEKYEHFVQLNPVIANLKAIFGLELD